MRKIEKDMVLAVANRSEWRKDNTSVVMDRMYGSVSIYLFGNLIAFTAGNIVVPCLATFREHPTRTTVSRLRALGIRASVKRGVAYIDGYEV